MRMRKKKNGEKRITNLAELLLSHDCVKLEDIESEFVGKRPLRLEIGCGKGDFICGISENEPEYNYIALERVSDVLTAAVEKYAYRRNLGSLSPKGGWLSSEGDVYDGVTWNIPVEKKGNVRFICEDAKNFLVRLPDESLDKIYTNFSDPWSKKGYASRRLTAPSFLNEYTRTLIKGGELRLKTDNDGLFDYSLETLGDSKLKIVASTRDLYSNSSFLSSNVETEYENHFKSLGVKIKALIAVKE